MQAAWNGDGGPEAGSIGAEAVGVGVHPRFLTNKPVGYARRVMSVDRAAERLDYVAATGLAEGIRKTIDWLRAAGYVAAWSAAARGSLDRCAA